MKLKGPLASLARWASAGNILESMYGGLTDVIVQWKLGAFIIPFLFLFGIKSPYCHSLCWAIRVLQTCVGLFNFGGIVPEPNMFRNTSEQA